MRCCARCVAALPAGGFPRFLPSSAPCPLHAVLQPPDTSKWTNQRFLDGDPMYRLLKTDPRYFDAFFWSSHTFSHPVGAAHCIGRRGLALLLVPQSHAQLLSGCSGCCSGSMHTLSVHAFARGPVPACAVTTYVRATVSNQPCISTLHLTSSSSPVPRPFQPFIHQMLDNATFDFTKAQMDMNARMAGPVRRRWDLAGSPASPDLYVGRKKKHAHCPPRTEMTRPAKTCRCATSQSNAKPPDLYAVTPLLSNLNPNPRSSWA
jgi:hypothetical protein